MVDDIPGLRRILRTSKVIAVVGLSGDWFRPSYFAAKYMLEHGYTVIRSPGIRRHPRPEKLQVAARRPGESGHRRLLQENRGDHAAREDAIAIAQKCCGSSWA